MLDRRILTEDPDRILHDLKRRHASEDTIGSFERLGAVVQRRREVQTEADELRASRNSLSKDIGALMREGKRDEAEAIKAKVKAGAERLGVLEDEQKTLEADELDLMLGLPNLLDDRVPEGKGEDDNAEVRRWGDVPSFDFEPKTHEVLAEALGIYDPERAAKISGARFAILSGAGARLERALSNYFLDRATQDHGYTELSVPHIVSRDAMTGTGQLPKFEEDLFRLAAEVNGADAFLIPTAEVPVTNIHGGEILDEAQLPLNYCALTACFRAEAGSYGKDTKGLIRQHQFWKVEMVKITTPEQSDEAHQALTQNAETILQALGLPYRTMVLCSGDIGFGAQLCYDIEVWLPGQNKYREISSCSNYGPFQARRMKLRYRPQGGKAAFCHTINGSGLAVGRTLVAILENYQQADGSVLIPEVLQPYMGGLKRIVA